MYIYVHIYIDILYLLSKLGLFILVLGATHDAARGFGQNE